MSALRRALASAALTLTLGLLVATVADRVAHVRFADEVCRAVRRHPPDPYVQVRAASQVDLVSPQGFRGDAIAERKSPSVVSPPGCRRGTSTSSVRCRASAISMSC